MARRRQRGAQLPNPAVRREDLPGDITPRQLQVLQMLRAEPALTNKELAARLGVSERGAKFHISALLHNFGVSGRIELVLVSAGETIGAMATP